ncbi:MAG: sigma-70 family RNA polymerase sigma factor [Planctomycetota bacterium]
MTQTAAPDLAPSPSPVLPRVAAGDPAAVSTCLDRYGPLVWSVAKRACASDADAEDVTQETFMSLWRDAARFDPDKGNEAAFVTTVARRRLADQLRRTGKPCGPIVQDVVAPTESESDDQAKQAIDAMNELSDDQRRVIDMSVFGGLTYREVAERAGMPLSTVKSHARRGLDALRGVLTRRADAARVRRETFRSQRGVSDA